MAHQSYEFYIERADAAARAADEAVLDNVRERELRSEKTWLGLAEQARGAAEERAKAAEDRAKAAQDRAMAAEQAAAIRAEEAARED